MPKRLLNNMETKNWTKIVKKNYMSPWPKPKHKEKSNFKNLPKILKIKLTFF